MPSTSSEPREPLDLIRESLRRIVHGPNFIAAIDPEIDSIPRNFDIFPSGLGSYQRSKRNLEQPIHYDLSQLKSLFLRSNREEDHIDSIYISSVQYCMQFNNANHRFLLFEVRDRHIPQILNFVVLDRMAQTSTPGSCCSSTSSLSSNTHADHRLLVSSHGKKDLFIKQCSLRPYIVVERLALPLSSSSPPLLLYELVILALETSGSGHMGDFRSMQSLWFAKCIWQCMLKLRPEAAPASLIGCNVLRRFKNLFRQPVDILEVERILGAANDGFVKFWAELTERQMLERTRLNANIELARLYMKENEELRHDIREIKRRKNTAI